jgi:tripartite ATP-independent transporter DctP family solute receptor
MTRTAFARSLASLTGLVVSAALVAPASAADFRVGSQFPANHSSSNALRSVVSEVKDATQGRVNLNLYTDSKLGGAFEVVDQIRTGQLDIDVSGPEWYGRLVPDLQVLDLPFLINSFQQAYCMIDGELGKELARKVAEKNLVVLGWMVNGFRHVTNNTRPITRPEDLAGMKIRTPPSKMYLDTFRALGANPTPVDIKELFQALQQGVVDGQENPYDNIENRKFNEVQKHVSNTGHFFAWTWIVANKRSYEKMSEADRAALNASLAKHIAAQRQNAAKLAEDSLGRLVAAGMTYTPIAPAQFANFRTKVAPVYDQVKSTVSEPTYAMAMKAADACKPR